ncbi:uncharacterized protein ACR2FA_011238 isoform 2-T2 [Aphomia sociella]
MFVTCVLLIFNLIGNLGARQPDIDINRVKLLPKESSSLAYQLSSTHSRRSLDLTQFSNDYDDSSSRFHEWRPPMYYIHGASAYKEPKPIKIHEAREDPRLFYQSDVYLKEVNKDKLNNEVTSIYPGRDMIMASEDRMRFTHHVCIRCPSDRTIIAKPGSDRVSLQHPRLQSCTPGRKLPRNVRFIRMYGPEFGSLLAEGSHIIVGRVTHMGKPLQICKMQIYVVAQRCPTPNNLIAHCEKHNKTCNFSCRHPKQQLYGEKILTCGENMKWNGVLPTCKAPTWCSPPTPPEHGRVSCKGGTSHNGSRLLEGSTCRVRCSHGWRWTPRVTAVCRRGAWTHGLTCQQRRH